MSPYAIEVDLVSSQVCFETNPRDLDDVFMNGNGTTSRNVPNSWFIRIWLLWPPFVTTPILTIEQ